MSETIEQRNKRLAPEREKRRQLRIKAFTILCEGKKPHCQCPGCDVDFILFLECDHIAGDGAAHRLLHHLGTGGYAMWKYVVDYPEERAKFQVLCSNCNSAKNTDERCPLYGQSHIAELPICTGLPIVEYDPNLSTLHADGHTTPARDRKKPN